MSFTKGIFLLGLPAVTRQPDAYVEITFDTPPTVKPKALKYPATCPCGCATVKCDYHKDVYA